MTAQLISTSSHRLILPVVMHRQLVLANTQMILDSTGEGIMRADMAADPYSVEENIRMAIQRLQRQLNHVGSNIFLSCLKVIDKPPERCLSIPFDNSNPLVTSRIMPASSRGIWIS